ncbi:bifunctional ADP-dependent (S)-NAD(P)H-hydrate dehydratase/NAD(P)H-hydrate epimerase [Hahella sp. CCB-MM4]|nr:bifunctional ADP-dependent (S)-NAD(P)H-hydrate dehydratase/NAD(P)H-hydrate epimerase [Hahella sp. CCB-MM4]
MHSTSGDVPTALYTASQVRKLDALAIAQTEGGGYALMRRAGRAAFRHLQRTFPEATSIAVFCGGGNNGGDGYVIAELAKQSGKTVRLIAVSDPEKLGGEAEEAWRQAKAAGVAVERVDDVDIDTVLEGAEIVVDALLGTGLSGEVREDYARVIHCINQAGKPVLAVDIPSGLSADSGVLLGATIKATLTSTFIGIKRGLLTGAASNVVGELWFDDLGVAPEVFCQVESPVSRVGFSDSKRLLPARDQAAHKGHFGYVLVVGGDVGFGGAVLMAAEAACRAGAGLVGCATVGPHISAGLVRVPEVMFKAVDHRQMLEKMLSSATVVALGPGLGQGPWGRMCFQTVTHFCRDKNISMVLDADGLNLLAEDPVALPSNTVITPHPGEAARLLGTTVPEVLEDRFASAEALARRYQATVVLKGAGTLIAALNGERALTSVMAEHGNPGMAAGGMGDVLTGMTAALMAQGMNGFDAARLAVSWHAHSADLAAARAGMISLVATDVIAGLGTAWLQSADLSSVDHRFEAELAKE